MSRIVDIEPLLHKYDRMNEGTEFSPIHFINDLMALEQQPCEDCIRVKKAWRLGYERGIYNATIHEGFTPIAWYTLSDSEIKKVEEKIKALKSQSCEDCISRAEALRHSHIEYDDDGEGHRVIYAEDIEELPSVTPQPKMGRWITQYNVAHQKEYYYCSECREEYSFDGETGIKMNDYKYCPNCGSKMEVIDNGKRNA